MIKKSSPSCRTMVGRRLPLSDNHTLSEMTPAEGGYWRGFLVSE